ncbi:ATP-binding protein [Streptomyces sp. NPDC001076]
MRERLGVPCADVQVCVTELVTNVIRHVGEGTPVRVRVVQAEGRIRVEVSDPEPRALPVLLSATETEDSGRGLALLDALVQRWGVELGPAGKTVWCELAEEAERGAPEAARRGMVSGVAIRVYTATMREEGPEDRRRWVEPGPAAGGRTGGTYVLGSGPEFRRADAVRRNSATGPSESPAP